MKTIIIGNELETTSNDIIKENSYDSLILSLKNKKIDLVIIGGIFPSCDETRDIFLYKKEDFIKEIKNINKNTNIVFMKKRSD